jgi:hypothetical protein
MRTELYTKLPCPFCGRAEQPHEEDCEIDQLRERVAHLEASEAELRGAVNYLMQRSTP